MDIDEAKYIYSQQAEQYERLICREDYLQNIPRALKRIASFEGVSSSRRWVCARSASDSLRRMAAPMAPAAVRNASRSKSIHSRSILQSSNSMKPQYWPPANIGFTITARM